ncbi:ornithine carbamoyltransferase [Paenibacillus tengchongensis]|uniref:ornithine carbamoyltransferase n=1 Tax=Paenibacillus tengchongensis TaxID=2608684 RepID=UPI00124E00FC|nr:ornithine carbamoyltransferase [Paenibacillus tengchongensis]
MHLPDIRTLGEEQVLNIFERADKLAAEENPNILTGKHFVLFFPETSLRTRITFERGIQELGGSCMLFPPQTLDKQEELRDVAGYLANWADGIIVRHSKDARIRLLAEHSPIPVINAMSAAHHPCEVLSDLYAIRSFRADYRDLTYTFVGPPGNVFNSWMEAAEVLNLNFNHVCLSRYQQGDTRRNYRFYTELEDILGESDVILTDSLPAELRTPEYIEKYQITVPRMRMSHKNAFINPCPPFTRGLEIHENVPASEYFAGYGFKKHLLRVQQAIVVHCLLN